jgi:hypothetical protein
MYVYIYTYIRNMCIIYVYIYIFIYTHAVWKLKFMRLINPQERKKRNAKYMGKRNSKFLNILCIKGIY